jgi:hypothetical protein
MQHNSVNCALHCYRHILIANISLQLQGFQALVILYIVPGNEELQPPQEEQKEHDEETKQEEHNEETDPRLLLYDEKLFKLFNNVGDGLYFFYSVSLFFKELHSQKNSTFPIEWLPYINITDSKTFCGSKIIQDLAEYLCTIGEADLDVLKECYGEYYSDDKNDIDDDIEIEDKVLPLKYALYVERVTLKTEESKIKVKGSWGRRLLAMAGEVTRHGQAHLYSWLITIVSLRSMESEESHRSEWKTKLLSMFLAVTCQHASGACQSHSRLVLNLREALRKYVELSPSTPPFLTLQIYSESDQYSLHSGIFFQSPQGHLGDWVSRMIL